MYLNLQEDEEDEEPQPSLGEEARKQRVSPRRRRLRKSHRLLRPELFHWASTSRKRACYHVSWQCAFLYGRHLPNKQRHVRVKIGAMVTVARRAAKKKGSGNNKSQ